MASDRRAPWRRAGVGLAWGLVLGALVAVEMAPEGVPVRPSLLAARGVALPFEATDRVPGSEVQAPVPDRLTRLARTVDVPVRMYEGVTAEIEDPHGAMDGFHGALLETATGQPGAITRIGHWSDSSLAGDGPSGEVRRRLQAAFGDAGHGWVQVDPGSKWYRHRDVRQEREGWSAVKLVGGKARDGRYGLGGAAAIGRAGATFEVGTVRGRPVGEAVGRFDLHYLRGPRFGKVELRLDGKRVVTLDTRAPRYAEAVYRVHVPDGRHRLEVRPVRGQRVKLFGVALEREQPGVVYDSFGVVGAKLPKLLRVDPVHWHRSLQLRPYDLVIAQFGGNSLQDPRLDTDKYRARMASFMGRFRAALPGVACLVVGTHDHGRRVHSRRIESDPRLPSLLAAQREAAFDAGCAWYSHLEAQGGPGAVKAWRHDELVSGDLRHLTRRGARRLSDLFFRALMSGFAGWVDDRAQREDSLAGR